MRGSKQGFTLIELLVVISIISLLSSVVLASLNTAREKARDVRRLADMHQLTNALELYLQDNGVYPSSDGAGCGGWDTPGNGTFIGALVPTYMPRNIADPRPDKDGACSNYQYYRYSPGDYNCDPNRGGYYVLMITDLERSGNPSPASPGWSCPDRNWQGEADWVMGRFEK